MLTRRGFIGTLAAAAAAVPVVGRMRLRHRPQQPCHTPIVIANRDIVTLKVRGARIMARAGWYFP